MTKSNVALFLEHATKNENSDLLNRLDRLGSDEITKEAESCGFPFSEAELLESVEKIKQDHFKVKPLGGSGRCMFLSAVADSSGWSCR
jgi:hypothetical protein